MEYRKLKDLLILSDSGTWGDLDTTGLGVPVLRSSNVHGYKLTFGDYASVIIPENDKKRKKLSTGDIIITKSSGSPELIGKSAIFYDPKNGVDYYFSNFMLRLRVRNEILDFKWLHYWLSSDVGRYVLFNMNNTTSGLRNLNNNLYLNQKIPILPLNDQKRIVAILDKADALRQKRKQALALLDDFLRSTFLEMFGDTHKNKKNWPLKKIEEIASKEKHSIKAGPFGSSLKKEYYVQKGYKIYGQEQVIRDDFKYGDYYIDEEKYKELESNKIQKGDILISLVGTYGKISIVPDEFEPGIINPRLMKITLNNSLMIPIFFKYLLLSKGIRSQIDNFSHGGTMDIVNVGLMKKIIIPIPPIDLQTQFAKIVEQTEATKAKMQQSLQELENQFQALMQRAFKGEL